MEPSLDELKQNYARLPDNKLLQLATHEAAKLRPEALEALRAEIEKRGMGEGVQRGIDIQFQAIDEDKLLAYCKLLQELPCPICGKQGKNLNASMVASVTSYIIMTSYSKKVLIACPECLDISSKAATIRSAIFGWWGIPWGIIRTLQALSINTARQREHHLPEPNSTLRTFTRQHIGLIEAGRGNVAALQDIIDRP